VMSALVNLLRMLSILNDIASDNGNLTEYSSFFAAMFSLPAQIDDNPED